MTTTSVGKGVRDFGGGQILKIGHLDEKALGNALLGYGLEPESGSEARAKQLVKYYATKSSELPPMECKSCGGWSEEDLSQCPFCGAQDDEDSSQPEVKTEQVQDEAEQMENVDNDYKDEDFEEQVAPKHTNGTTALTKRAKASPIVLREKELDQAVAHIRDLQVQGNVCVWEIGQAVKRIYDSELWMARHGEKGSRYKAFDQFVREELGVSAPTAISWMKIAADFSEQQVREIGPSKLSLVLQAPVDKRKELVEKAKKTSKEKIRAEVKKANAESGRGRKRKAKPKVTAISLAERFVVQLFCKPEKGEELRRAKSIKDEPWGKFELANGVIQMFRVREAAKGLEIVVVSKRQDDEE